MKYYYINKSRMFSSIVCSSMGVISLAIGLSMTSSAAVVPKGVSLAKVQQLTVANGTEPKSLDPAFAEDSTSQEIVGDLFEGLVRVDAYNKVHPGIATSWSISKNGLVYTFHLHKGAKWSDGSPLTAKDFVYGFERSVDPKVAAPLGYLIAQDFVKNSQAVMDGKKPSSALGVKALNAHTLQITLDTPNPHFLTDLINPVMFPVKKAAVDKWGKQWTLPKHFVSDGAYKLQSWVVNGHITLVRNKNYWDNKETIINKVTYLPVAGASALNDYRAGLVGLTSPENVNLALADYRQFKTTVPHQVRNSPWMGIYYYDMNVTKPPFNNVDVRKGLSYAVNRKMLTTYVTGQGEVPSFTFLPQGAEGYEKPASKVFSLSYGQRVKVAQKLIKAAGYTPSHPLTFTLKYNTSKQHKDIALAISSMWNKAFHGSVKVALENEEWKTFLTTRQEGNYEMARDGWLSDADPSGFMDVLLSNNVQNSSRWKNADYDHLVQKADRDMNPAERARLYKQAQAVILQDMPVIPIYQYAQTALVKPYVGGVVLTPVSSIYTRNLYIKAHHS